MFNPKTEYIKLLAEKYSKIISSLEAIFNETTNIYIDFANVRHWQKRLGWHIEIKRLKQFFDSFNTINSVKFYYGTAGIKNMGNDYAKEAKKAGFDVRTKPVKIMKLSIDVSGVEVNSPSVLKDFVSKFLLNKLDLETIEFLNEKLRQLNAQGIRIIEVPKCNFDVEIGRDMLLDYERGGVDNFILWSGDSDFADPVHQLIDDNKKVAIFATARRVAVELNETKAQVFDIKKIREFICWKKELPQDVLAIFKTAQKRQKDLQ